MGEIFNAALNRFSKVMFIPVQIFQKNIGTISFKKKINEKINIFLLVLAAVGKNHN
jgi:hypothetical protein